MLRIHITSDNLSESRLRDWARSNLRCNLFHCPPNTLCSECAFDNRCTNPNITFGGERPTGSGSLKNSLLSHCLKSKCNDKKGSYDCMFMVNGTCQLDYHCPADLPTKGKE